VPLLFGILVSAGVIFAIFAVTVGRGGSMTQFQPDWPGQPLPQDRPVRGSDLADARFSVAFRGYRMAEVDDALDRLAVEIAQRDERIAQLTGQPYEPDPSAVTVVPGAGEPVYDPAGYQQAGYDTAVYQPIPQDPYASAQNPYVTDPTATPYVDPTATPYVDPTATPYVDPTATPYAHGYPPGVLDGGRLTQPIQPTQPTQPIQPIQPIQPNAGTADPGEQG
jgi:DivIVA domain-containing protein